MSRVLVVDDEESLRLVLRTLLRKHGYEVEVAASAEEALGLVERFDPGFVLADVRMPGMSGIELCETLRARGSSATVIVMSAYGSVELALEAMNAGAYDYVPKPFKQDEVLLALRKAEERESLRRENRALKEAIRKESRFSGMLGKSEPMQRVFRLVEKVADYKTTVLVEGESGTGKELVAEAVHQHSKRKDGPLVVFDCSAVAPNLIESELFGHVKGAFTGAVVARAGAFERAQGGTLFLDEMGELPLDLQPKLLRVLEQKEVRRVGDSVMRPVDVQVVAATNRDLEASCQAGRFREELLARLAGAVLRLPPLRERREDILLLARHFAGPDLRLSVRLVNAMLTYDWPLNVRELRNLMVDELPRGDEHVLRRLSSERPRSVSTPPSAESRPSDPSALLGSNKRRPAHGPSDAPPSREAMAELLQNHHGNLSLLERVTGYSRRHLRRLASEDYGLDLDAYRSAAAPPAPSDLRAQK